MSKINLEVKAIKLPDSFTALDKRHLLPGGKVQTYVDNEAMKHTGKRMPFDTGAMEHSMPIHSDIGSGILKVVTPYAHYQNEHNPGPGSKPGEPLRGKNFFERMKNECRDDILRGAAKIAGAEVKT